MRKYNKYVINIDNLECNINLIRRILRDKVKLCAVVKADAYGLGVRNVVPVIDKYVDFYAVANLDEAMEIRALGVDTNILILSPVSIDDIDTCAKNNISISVSDNDYLRAVLAHLHSTVKVHLKVNTGLNRFGFKDVAEFAKAVKFIKKSNNIILQGVFTHFATKKNDIEFINIQKNIFNEFAKLVPQYVIRHCANSFATMLSSTNQMDMVRVGANMYGDIRGDGLPLKDVLSIKSEVVFISDVSKHQTIGYDRTYKCHRRSKIAVVPMGYADGIDRNLSNKFYVLINGEKAPIVGNICMDCFMIDVTDIKNVYVGSEVVVLGSSYDEEIRLNDVAERLNRSAYDVLLNYKYHRCEQVLVTKKGK